jgi:Ca-activated chloride channel family protein
VKYSSRIRAARGYILARAEHIVGHSTGRHIVGCAAVAVWAVLLAGLGTLGAQEHDPQQFVISKDVDLVLLPVTVRNSQGQFISGLKISDFQVYEKGQQQKISIFRDEDVPVTVGLVVDHSGSMVAWRDQVIEGARAFVQASNVQDKEFVVNFGSGVAFTLPQTQPFTNDVDALQAALSTPYARGKTELFDALADALQHIQRDTDNKKVLLLISDGGDNASEHTFAQVLRMAQARNVLIYSIGLLDELSADQNPPVLKKLAAATGGESYFPVSAVGLVADCRLIAGDIRHQYTLGYTPSDDSSSGYRKIRLHVSARGRGKLSVRTRPGYFLPSTAAPQSSTKRY